MILKTKKRLYLTQLYWMQIYNFSWCYMSDEIDIYVERNLKNWAASQRPRVDGRQRLLIKAEKPALNQRNKLAQILSALIVPNDPFERTIYPQSEWETGPALSLMVNSFHFASSWRMVH